MSMMPQVNFNLQITGNDCRCCHGVSSNHKRGDRVVYRRGEFIVSGNSFLDGSESRRMQEDAETRKAIIRIVDAVKEHFRLHPEVTGPALRDDKYVQVRDVEVVQSWIDGVKAKQYARRTSFVPRVSSEGTPLTHAANSNDPYEVSARALPPTPLTIRPSMPGMKVKSEGRVVWDEGQRCYFVCENSFVDRMREECIDQNRRTRQKIDEDLAAMSEALGIARDKIPMPRREKVERPMTYEQMRMINAWLHGLSSENLVATFGEQSSSSTDIDSPQRRK